MSLALPTGRRTGRDSMRLGRNKWLSGAALVIGMVLSAEAALAKQSDQPIDIGTFSGAFLAARVAEVDNDIPGAIAYYRRALVFDPDDQSLQQSLLLALISQG